MSKPAAVKKVLVYWFREQGQVAEDAKALQSVREIAEKQGFELKKKGEC
jgi:hypothetical protein